MAPFSPSVLILAVLAYYFGMLIGYKSGNFIVCKIAEVAAHSNLFITNRQARLSVWGNIGKIGKSIRRGRIYASDIMSGCRKTISDYREDSYEKNLKRIRNTEPALNFFEGKSLSDHKICC